MRIALSLLLFTIPLMVLSCAPKPKPFATASVEQLPTVVIFVPGYKGSVLVEEHGHIAWVTVWDALFNGRTLRLPNPDAGLRGTPLRASSVLHNVTALFGAYSVDIYGSLLSQLTEAISPNVEVSSLPYDWRQSNIVTVGLLAERVAQKRRAGAKRIVLVGHSMGGLVVSYYLRYGAQLPSAAIDNWEGARAVDAAVIAGVPFQGSVKVFRDMQTGAKTLYNRTLLDAEALSSFPSTYELLPARPDGVVSNDYLDVLDPELWIQRSLGLLRNCAAAECAQRASFTRRVLTETRSFRERLSAPPSQETRPMDFPLLSITCIDRTTESIFRERDDGSFDWKNPEFANGDEIVSAASSTLPTAYQRALSVQELRVKSPHERLLVDEVAFPEMLRFLSKNAHPVGSPLAATE
ncbi:MAG: alpha/beta fold hydrolase [Deltaproteobacteria bacterium]|nr:alpha/beta fold hydrolase [Deltaproteobacteria bacterium]